MAHRPLRTILFWGCWVILATSCGSERTTSGVWRDLGCTDDDPKTPCLNEVYELHLGRYGDTVTGVIVRYRGENGLDPYQRTSACDCFFIESGRALSEDLEFRLFKSNSACAADQKLGPGGCETCECEARRFKLTAEDSDTLVGTMRCPDAPPSQVRFERTRGRVRTSCADLLESK